MNFKIENNYISIINYPTLAKHFEKMATKGWLINKIYLGNLFIYKRITPKNLDFAITPYIVETQYSRKSKSELEEFRSVCESVGWNYAAKTTNFHIYYKEKGIEALSLQTDTEEEFKILESIGKKHLSALYFQIAMFLFLFWFNLQQLLTGVDGFKDAFPQLFFVLIPFFILSSIIEIYHFKKFFKHNSTQISLGEDITFSRFNFRFNKFTFLLTSLILVIFIIHLLYGVLFLENTILLYGVIPPLLVFISFFLYRIFVKPSRMPMKSKKRELIFILVLATIIPVLFFSFLTMNLINGKNEDNSIISEDYKVISINDFTIEEVSEGEDLIRQSSLLVPVSYVYYSHSDKPYRNITTEYSKALTEDLAITLVNRYKNQAEIPIEWNRQEIEYFLKEGIYKESLFKRDAKISEEEFNTLRKGDLKNAVETAVRKMKDLAIIKDHENLWDLDEVYFLNVNKSEIVLRQGKEVIFIEASDLNFADSEVIEIAKKKLDLN